MSDMQVTPQARAKPPACYTCTIQLVQLAYRRAPWFRLVREPLRLGMQVMAAWHHIKPAGTPSCAQSWDGCMRFYKTALKERSATFRWLNDKVNPLFDALLERIVTPAEVREAKQYARTATAEVPTSINEEREGFLPGAPAGPGPSEGKG